MWDEFEKKDIIGLLQVIRRYLKSINENVGIIIDNQNIEAGQDPDDDDDDDE